MDKDAAVDIPLDKYNALVQTMMDLGAKEYDKGVCDGVTAVREAFAMRFKGVPPDNVFVMAVSSVLDEVRKAVELKTTTPPPI